MSAASLLAAGQRFLRDNFPAVIEIGGARHACATSGLRRGMALADGGAEISRAVSFWVPLQAFVSAGQSIPREQTPVYWEGEEYTVESVSVDPARINVILACTARPQ